MYLTELLFRDKRKFKRLDMAFMIRKKHVTLTLYSFAPSDMNFQWILMPKVILAKILSQKIYSFGPFSS